jgi:hypothetical protein
MDVAQIHRHFSDFPPVSRYAHVIDLISRGCESESFVQKAEMPPSLSLCASVLVTI